MITSSGSTPSASRAARAARCGVRTAPTSRASRPASSPVDRERVESSRPARAQVQHHLGDAAGEKDANRRVMRAVRQHVDEPRHLAVDRAPVVDRRASQSGGVRDRRDVQQQVRRAAERRVHDHRVAHGGVGEDVARRRRRARARSAAARAERRATSFQIGCPDGASAACGTVSPSASATTCDVAAVPRNWHPPPGDAHARQPSSAASSSGSLRTRSARRSSGAAPASTPSVGGSVTPPGTRTAGRSWQPASAIIIAGRPLSHVATPITPRAASAANASAAAARSPRRCGRAGCPSCPCVPCVRPSHGSVTKPANGIMRRSAQRLGRGPHQQPDLPVARVVAEREGRAVRLANAALRAEDQELRLPERGGLPAHADVLRPAEDVPARPRQQVAGPSGSAPAGPGCAVVTS